MAVPLAGHLQARKNARFHVQVKIGKIPTDIQTPAQVLVEGVVVQVFRSDGSLGLGDRVGFLVWVCREGDHVPLGPVCGFLDRLASATHIEVYLNGAPPRCEVALDEWLPLETASDEPRLTVEDLERQIREARKRKRGWWWFRPNTTP